MNDERNPNETNSAVFSHLNGKLVEAINSGDETAIIVALREQTLTPITESINNHLVVRSFLAGQRDSLIAVRNNLEAPMADSVVSEHIGEYLDILAVTFCEMFMSSDDEGSHGELSGDDSFRKVLTSSIEAAQYITSLSVNRLGTVEELFKVVEWVRDEVAEALIQVWYSTKSPLEYAPPADSFKEVVDEQIWLVEQTMLEHAAKAQ